MIVISLEMSDEPLLLREARNVIIHTIPRCQGVFRHYVITHE